MSGLPPDFCGNYARVTLRRPVASNSTPLFYALVVDQNGNAIGGSGLGTLTLTIVDTSTIGLPSPTVINGCLAANILNAGRGTIDGSGNLYVQLESADTNTDESPGLTQVPRSLVVDWTYDSGSSVGRFRIDFTIFVIADGL